MHCLINLSAFRGTFLCFALLLIDTFFKLSENESHSGQDLPIHKGIKSATLVEDDFLFSLSTDDEFNNAEATDKKYEKQKEDKKQKAKYSKKSSKKQKEKVANMALSDNEGGESEEGGNIENGGDDLAEEEGDEEKEKEKEDNTPKAESYQGPFNPIWTGAIRSKNTLYNKSLLSGM